ncbi:MAG: hypothetical protein CL525_13235 [Aequorivita sp.]|nr:hypothetical protein [Aequorivita sp.]
MVKLNKLTKEQYDNNDVLDAKRENFVEYNDQVFTIVKSINGTPYRIVNKKTATGKDKFYIHSKTSGKNPFDVSEYTIPLNINYKTGKIYNNVNNVQFNYQNSKLDDYFGVDGLDKFNEERNKEFKDQYKEAIKNKTQFKVSETDENPSQIGTNKIFSLSGIDNKTYYFALINGIVGYRDKQPGEDHKQPIYKQFLRVRDKDTKDPKDYIKDVIFNYKTKNIEFKNDQGLLITVPSSKFKEYGIKDVSTVAKSTKAPRFKNAYERSIRDTKKKIGDEIEIPDARGETYFFLFNDKIGKWTARSPQSDTYHKLIYDMSDNTYNIITNQGRIKTFDRGIIEDNKISRQTTETVQDLMTQDITSLIENTDGEDLNIQKSKLGFIYVNPRGQKGFSKLHYDKENNQYWYFASDDENSDVKIINPEFIGRKGLKPDDFDYSDIIQKLQTANDNAQQNIINTTNKEFTIKKMSNDVYYVLHRTDDDTAEDDVKLLFTREHRVIEGQTGKIKVYSVSKSGTLTPMTINYDSSSRKYDIENDKVKFSVSRPSMMMINFTDDANKANPRILDETNNPALTLTKFGKYYLYNNEMFLFTEVQEDDKFHIKGYKKAYLVKSDGTYEEVPIYKTQNTDYDYKVVKDGVILFRFKADEVTFVADDKKPPYNKDSLPTVTGAGMKGIKGQSYKINNDQYTLTILGNRSWIYRVDDNNKNLSYLFYLYPSGLVNGGRFVKNKLKIDEDASQGIARSSTTGYINSDIPDDLDALRTYIAGNGGFYPLSYEQYKNLHDRDNNQIMNDEDSYDLIDDLYNEFHSGFKRFTSSDIEYIYNEIKEKFKENNIQMTRKNILNDYSKNFMTYYQDVGDKHAEENKDVKTSLDITGDFKNKDLVLLEIQDLLRKKYSGQLVDDNDFYDDESLNIYNNILDDDNGVESWKNIKLKLLEERVNMDKFPEQNPELWAAYKKKDDLQKKMDSIELTSVKTDVIGMYKQNLPNNIINYVNNLIINELEKRGLEKTQENYRKIYVEKHTQIQDSIDQNRAPDGSVIDPTITSNVGDSRKIKENIIKKIKDIDEGRENLTDKQIQELAQKIFDDSNEDFITDNYITDQYNDNVRAVGGNPSYFLDEVDLKEQIKRALQRKGLMTANKYGGRTMTDQELIKITNIEFAKWIKDHPKNDGNKYPHYKMTDDEYYNLIHTVVQKDEILSTDEKYIRDSQQSEEYKYLNNVLIPFMGFTDTTEPQKIQMYHYLKYEFLKNGVNINSPQSMTNYVRNNKSTQIQIEHIKNNTYTGKLDLNKPILDIPQDEDPPDVPNPSEFRETGHGSRNIFDMGNTASNEEITRSIKGLNERHQQEDTKDETFEEGVIHLKQKQNLEILAQKGIGLNLGVAYADPRGLLEKDQVIQFLTSQKDLADVLKSYGSRYNKTETFKNYITRIQTDPYYDKWLTERDNLLTNKDFDQYKAHEEKSFFGKTTEFIGNVIGMGLNGFTSIAVLKSVGDIIQSALISVVLKTSRQAFQTNTIKLTAMDRILSRSKIYDARDVRTLPDEMPNIQQLMSSALMRINRQDVGNVQFDLVREYLKRELVKSSFKFQPSSEQLQEQMKNIRQMIPEKFLKDPNLEEQLSRDIPDIDYEDLTIRQIRTNIKQMRRHLFNNNIINQQESKNIIDAEKRVTEDDYKKWAQQTHQFFIKKWFENFASTDFLKKDTSLLFDNSGPMTGQYLMNVEAKIMTYMREIWKTKDLFIRDYDEMIEFVKQTPGRAMRYMNDADFHRMAVKQYAEFAKNHPFTDRERSKITRAADEMKSSYNDLFFNNVYRSVMKNIELRNNIQQQEKIIKFFDMVLRAYNYLSFRGVTIGSVIPNNVLRGIQIAATFKGAYSILNRLFADRPDEFNIVRNVLDGFNDEDFKTFVELANQNVTQFKESKVKPGATPSDIFEQIAKETNDTYFADKLRQKNLEDIQARKRKFNIPIDENLLRPKLPENALFALTTLSFIRINIIRLKNVIEQDDIADYFQINYKLDKRMITGIESLNDEYQVTKALNLMLSGEKSMIKVIFMGMLNLYFILQYNAYEKNIIQNKERYFYNFMSNYVSILDGKYTEEEIKTIVKRLHVFYNGFPLKTPHLRGSLNRMDAQIFPFIQNYLSNLVRDFLPHDQHLSSILGESILTIFSNSIGLSIINNFNDIQSLTQFLSEQSNFNTYQENLKLLQNFLIQTTNGLIDLKLDGYFKTFNSKIEMNIYNDIFNHDNILFNSLASKQIKLKKDNNLPITGLIFYDSNQPALNIQNIQDLNINRNEAGQIDIENIIQTPEEGVIRTNEDDSNIPDLKVRQPIDEVEVNYSVEDPNIPDKIKIQMNEILNVDPNYKFYYSRAKGWVVENEQNKKIELSKFSSRLEKEKHRHRIRMFQINNKIKPVKQNIRLHNDVKEMNNQNEIEVKSSGEIVGKVPKIEEIKAPKNITNETQKIEVEVDPSGKIKEKKGNLRREEPPKEEPTKEIEKKEKKGNLRGKEDKEDEIDIDTEDFDILEEKRTVDMNTDGLIKKDEVLAPENVGFREKVQEFAKYADYISRSYKKDREFNIKDDVIVFRGTTNKKESLQNLDIDLIKFRNSNDKKVHKGLYLQYKEVFGKYKDELKKYIENKKTVDIAGHSKGSALALYFAQEFPKDVKVNLYLYGTPNLIGNDAFFDMDDNINIYNIAVKDDPISMITNKNYKKLKRNIVIDDNGIYVKDDNKKSYSIEGYMTMISELNKNVRELFISKRHSTDTYNKLFKNLINK